MHRQASLGNLIALFRYPDGRGGMVPRADRGDPA